MPCVSILIRTARNELIEMTKVGLKLFLAIRSAEPEINETDKVKCSLVTLKHKSLRFGKTIGMENRSGVGWGENLTTEELLKEILGEGRVLYSDFGGVYMTAFVKTHRTV